jgi:hypothetical protein
VEAGASRRRDRLLMRGSGSIGIVVVAAAEAVFASGGGGGSGIAKRSRCGIWRGVWVLSLRW